MWDMWTDDPELDAGRYFEDPAYLEDYERPNITPELREEEIEWTN